MAIAESDKKSEIPHEVQNKLCSAVCKQTVKHYRDHNQKVCDELKQWEIKSKHTILAIENLEKQINAHEVNETQFKYDIAYAKWERDTFKDKVDLLTKKLAEVTCERDRIRLNVSNLENASKSVNKLINSQIHDKLKTGLGYSNVPPPYNNNYFPSKTDIDINSLKEGMNDDVKKIDPVKSLEENLNFDKVEIREWCEEDDQSDSTSESFESSKSSSEGNKKVTGLVSELNVDKLEEGKRLFQEKVKHQIKQVINTNKARKGLGFVSKTVKQESKSVTNLNDKCINCDCKTRLSSPKPFTKNAPRGNQRNWNQMVSQRLGQNFQVVKEKSCYICGKTNHLQHDCYHNPKNYTRGVKPLWTAANMINKQNFKSKVNHVATVKRMKNTANSGTTAATATNAAVIPPNKANRGKKTNTVRSVTTVKHAATASVKNSKRMFTPSMATTARIINTSLRVNTVRPIPTVKSEISWVWKPKNTVASKVSKFNSASKSIVFQRVDFHDAHGKPKTKLVWVPKRN